MSTKEYPTELTPEVVAALAAPFPLDLVEVKPGATNREKTRALALAYVDWRAYARQLDEVVGPTNWSFKLQPWGPTRIIAELTIFGITKSASGEGDASDENCGTIAEAQAKKRACSEFGLGRYLYDLPNDRWFDYNPDKKRFVEPDSIVAELYRAAGLPAKPVMPVRRAAAEAQPAPPRPRTAQARQSQAREALAQAEQRTGVTPVVQPLQSAIADSTPPMASKVQVRQLIKLGREAESLAEGRFGARRFYDLTAAQADTLIHQLQS